LTAPTPGQSQPELLSPGRHPVESGRAYQAKTGAKYVLVIASWIEVELVFEDGSPAAGDPYKITLASGEVREGKLDAKGMARLESIPPGTCQVEWPSLDAKETAPRPEPEKPPTAWIELELIDEAGNPMAEEEYRLERTDGIVKEGKLDKDGHARIEDLPEGEHRLSWPKLDRAAVRPLFEEAGLAEPAPEAAAPAAAGPQGLEQGEPDEGPGAEVLPPIVASAAVRDERGDIEGESPPEEPPPPPEEDEDAPGPPPAPVVIAARRGEDFRFLDRIGTEPADLVEG
jgi:hypothetical protein